MSKDIKLLKSLLGYYAISDSENQFCLGEIIMSYIESIENPLHEEISMYQDEHGNIIGEVVYGDDFVSVGLNAHIDTVPHTEPLRDIEYNDGVFTATNIINGEPAILGADDRAGIFSILKLLESDIGGYKGTIRFYITVSEEIGMIGAGSIDHNELSADMMIVFDRRGSSDAVVSCSNQSFCGYYFEDYLNNLGDYNTVVGGYSDAVVFSSYGIPSVNLSVGYYNEHTTKEKLVYSELLNAIDFAKKTISGLTENIVNRIVFEDYTTNKSFEKNKKQSNERFQRDVVNYVEEFDNFDF